MLKHFMLDHTSRVHDHSVMRGGLLGCALAVAGLQAAACADEREDSGVGWRLQRAAAELGDGAVAEIPCSPRGDGMDASVGSGASVVDGGTVDARTGDGGEEPVLVRGLRVEEVSALGSGCPRGTVTARVGPDGRDFVLTFAGAPVTVDADDAFRPVTCGISIFARAPADAAYAIAGFTLAGDASLVEGQSLRLTSSYSFGASTPSSASKSLRIDGPHSGALRFEQELSESERVFSPCGGVRFVNLDLSLNLRNGTPRRAGSFQLSELASLRFVTRPCSGSAASRVGVVAP